MTPETAMQLALAAPLVGTVLIVLTGNRPNLRETVTLVTAVVMFLLVASLLPTVMAGGQPEVTLGYMLPGLPLLLKLEPLGMIFALVASFLWIVTSIYSIGYMRGHHEQNQTQFYAFFAVALFSAIGVAFAGNLLTLFVAYEVLSVSTYPLVAHHRTDEAKRGGRVYLGLLLFTSIAFQLVAIVWTWLATGTLDFVAGGILAGKVSPTVGAVLLVLYVYGIGKAAVMPFHRWLPAAMVAPTPVSALLHAVAVVKAGVFSVVKVAVYVFGIDFLHGLAAGPWMQYAAAATILLASLVAMTKDNLKARLAYSTVSQLSYIVLGAMLATEISVTGAGMHIAMHAFGKITLFFCAGAYLVAAHKTEISQLRGIGRRMPITTFAFLIGSLSIIGLPPFGGLWSKWYLALGALEADKMIMVVVLMLSSLLNIAYLLPIPIRGFFCEPDDNPGHGGDGRIHEAPWPCVLALSVSALGCLVLFFFPEPAYQLLGKMFAS